MPGHFFPAPPTFVGGRQPFAPKDGIPRSGLTPPPVRSYATLVAIAVASIAGPPAFIGGKQPYAAPLGQVQSAPAASQPPARSYAAGVAISNAWLPPPGVYVGGEQPYAPELGTAPYVAAPGPPQPLSRVNLGTIRQSWELPTFVLETSEGVAAILPQPVVSGPPSLSKALGNIQAAWSQDVVTVISLSSIAPFLADPGPPLPTTYVVQQTIRQAWDIPPYAIPRAGTIAALLSVSVAPDAPPVRSYASLFSIRQRWEFPPPAAQGGSRLAPLIPAPAAASAPPPYSWAEMFAVRSSWEPQPYALPKGANIAPLLPVVQGPPPLSYGTLFSIRAGWEPSPYRLPSGARLAPLIPPPAAPDPPPRTSNARLMSVIRLHDPAQWWPQPEFVRVSWSTQSGASDALPTTFITARVGRRSMTFKAEELK